MIEYIPETNPDFLRQKLISLDKDSSVKGIILLACDANNYKKNSIDAILKDVETPLFGGIFPGIILNKEKYNTGFIALTLEQTPIINMIKDLSKENSDFDIDLMSISEAYSETKTMFVFVDGLSKRIGDFIESLFTIFGLEFSYIGGGAGSLSFKQKPCVFTNKGVFEDCAVIAGVEIKSEIGVKHGWNSIAGPFKITSASRTRIITINYRPAYEVYKEVVEKHSNKNLSREHFFKISKAYPFGISKLNAETVVRDLIFVEDDDSLGCIGEINSGAYVNILSGNKESLVKAAGNAIKTGLDEVDNFKGEFIFFIDCISRVLFLEDDFKEELNEVFSYSKGVPLIGALTLGEVANNKKDYLEFYNKTSVIGCF